MRHRDYNAKYGRNNPEPGKRIARGPEQSNGLVLFLVVSFERKGYISKLGLQEDAAAPDAREEKATA